MVTTASERASHLVMFLPCNLYELRPTNPQSGFPRRRSWKSGEVEEDEEKEEEVREGVVKRG